MMIEQDSCLQTALQQTEHLREIARRRQRALVDGDLALARTLHADDFQLVTPIGSMLSRLPTGNGSW